MDIRMPEMDGYEATRVIRAREKTQGLPHIPIIGVTAHALRHDKEKCLQAGMDDYIAKPFDPEILHRKIVALVNAEHSEIARSIPVPTS